MLRHYRLSTANESQSCFFILYTLLLVHHRCLVKLQTKHRQSKLSIEISLLAKVCADVQDTLAVLKKCIRIRNGLGHAFPHRGLSPLTKNESGKLFHAAICLSDGIACFYRLHGVRLELEVSASF
jgi:hypothetical protein